MSLEPSEREVQIYAAALQAQSTWNVQIAKTARKGHPPPKMRPLHEFVLRFGDMPDPKPPEKRLSPQEQWERLKDAFLATGMKPINKEP